MFPLKFNDTGARVFLLQECLAFRGLLNGIDGCFGSGTEESVKQFQGFIHLEVDGIVGKQTWARLIEGRYPRPTSLPLDKSQIDFIFNNEITAEDLTLLNGAMELFDISTSARIRHFLAQLAHESGGLVYFEEIADGSDYERNDDPDDTWADLGNTEEGDGRRFKGVDSICTTGRKNYQKLADHLGDQRVMEGYSYVIKNVPRFLPSGFWWHDNDMNTLVDTGATCREISTKVNGADPANGLAEREEYYDLAGEVIFE